jgi:hypothetical protein
MSIPQNVKGKSFNHGLPSILMDEISFNFIYLSKDSSLWKKLVKWKHNVYFLHSCNFQKGYVEI